MTRPLLTPILFLSALSACGSETSGAAGATAASGGAGPRFEATNACAILSEEKVAAATGLKVAGSTLSSVTQPTATLPGFSACTYRFAQGGTLGFYARRSPAPDTPETIAQIRKAVIDGMGAKTADVTGLGTSAFSAQPMEQLHVFFGEDKYVYFMIDRAPLSKPALDAERALAASVIG